MSRGRAKQRKAASSCAAPALTPRRLAGGLLWSLCMARSQIAREAELRILARRLAGQRISGTCIVVGASPGFGRQPGRLQALLRDWRRPTMTGKTGGVLRALALAQAELGVRPCGCLACRMSHTELEDYKRAAFRADVMPELAALALCSSRRARA